jgi:LysM repeat protein
MMDTHSAADDARVLGEGDPIDDRARAVFAGLVPATRPARRHPVSPTAMRVRSAAFTTVPVVLTGAIALGLGLSGPVDPAHARKPLTPKPEQAPSPFSLRAALSQWGAAIVPGALATSTVATTAAPAVYSVEPGDTVSSVAQRFGLSTASVLALNGLSWRSTIFPGQVLTLTTAPVKTTAPPPARTQAGRYTILKGDTVSAIADRFGVSMQSLLAVNGLDRDSIIYPGQALTIPGRQPAAHAEPAPIVGVAADAPRIPVAPVEPAPAPEQSTGTTAAAVAALPIAERPVLPVSFAARPSAPAPGSPSGAPPSGGAVTPLTAEMRTHAATIIRVGRELGVPQYGIVIALATAMQESTLRNLSWGDRDSVGLFQQRPSSGWGTAADLQVPSHAARLFYVGRSGYTRGLLDIAGWQSMTLTQAAQAVQISAYPNHYAKWEASAWAWYYELT